MSYRPADSGLSQYFMSMLDDQDRNLKYRDAIQRCVRCFVSRERRSPRVLDVGVGTGLLSAICLEAGVEHVTGVDVNSTMVGLATQNLREVDPLRKRFKVTLVEPGKVPFKREEQFDMVVSEILGTLTTSESMCKYLSLYRPHIRTFGEGGEARVYMVPRRTEQRMSLYAFEREALGPALSIMLASVACATRHKLLPTNEGGLNLMLHLYPSRELEGSRETFHVETYERMESVDTSRAGALCFDVSSGGAREVCLSGVDEEKEVVLGLMEWEVVLWSDADEVVLRNTLEEYRRLSLRNSAARASAWGFFVVGLPLKDDGYLPERLQLKWLKMHPARQSHPELLVNGEKVSNIADDALRYLATAADADLLDKLARAMDLARLTAGDRVLIVNDITCGALAAHAAKRGLIVRHTHTTRDTATPDHRVCTCDADGDAHHARTVHSHCRGRRRRCAALTRQVDVVNEDVQLAAFVSLVLDDLGCLPDETEDEPSSPDSDRSAAVSAGGQGRVRAILRGRVATGEGRASRSLFVPSAAFTRCYQAIVFPSRMLDSFAADARRLQEADAITSKWLLAGGMQIPSERADKLVCARTYRFDAASLFGSAGPRRLWGPALLGALRVVLPSKEAMRTTDHGLCYHAVHLLEWQDDAATPCGAAEAIEVTELHCASLQFTTSLDEMRKMCSAGVLRAGGGGAALRSAMARMLYLGVALRSVEAASLAPLALDQRDESSLARRKSDVQSSKSHACEEERTVQRARHSGAGVKRATEPGVACAQQGKKRGKGE